MDELLEKAVQEICGKEREIIDNFCKVTIAAEHLLNEKDVPYLIRHLQLNRQETVDSGRIVHHYWFSFRCSYE